MNETIKDIFGLKPVVAKGFPKALPLPNPDPSLIYGVELEIENAYNWEAWAVSGITATDDGSLRNMGKEFITQPMTYSNLVYCLQTFFDKSKVTQESNYSERCSIHVHANCQDLTTDQLQTLLMIYQVVEKLMFSFVGGDRDQNIFCVPWSQTALTYSLMDNPKDAYKYKRWAKYTALNLIPLISQGTVEFRHMPGHCDTVKLYTWLRIIGCLFAYAKKTSLKEAQDTLVQLNTNSQYLNILYSVFPTEVHHFTKIPGYEAMLEQGVLDIKYGLLTSNKEPQKTAPAAMMFDQDLLARIHRAQVAEAQIPPAPLGGWVRMDQARPVPPLRPARRGDRPAPVVRNFVEEFAQEVNIPAERAE